ncbi:MAG: CBS domain-containing protein [Pseudomonadota bacterium]|nr:CBS domain-containing protein [Pseudomonadota bacterium]
MKISQCMSRTVDVSSPEEPISAIATRMRQLDSGVIPLGENDRLVGVITDRDIVVRAVAAGRGPDTPAREAMSPEILYCYEDDALESVASNMAEQKVRRLPVVDSDKRLVGIVSLGDIARADGRAGEAAFRAVSEQGGLHSQQ